MKDVMWIMAFMIAVPIVLGILIAVSKPHCESGTVAIWTNAFNWWVCMEGYRP